MSDDSDSAPDLIRIISAGGVTLEAEAHLPPQPRAAVVITHPHPLYGGSMHDGIPAVLFRASKELGVAAVRFNFRGVGRSTGTHDAGVAERLDVAAAVRALRGAVGPAVPLGIAGWSFGADMALALDADTAETQGVQGWMAVAAPLSVVPPAEMAAASSSFPKLLLAPENDFRPPQAVSDATADWAATEVVTVMDNDHFLSNGHQAVLDGYRRFITLLEG